MQADANDSYDAAFATKFSRPMIREVVLMFGNKSLERGRDCNKVFNWRPIAFRLPLLRIARYNPLSDSPFMEPFSSERAD
jgi:hypothetical protein